jgi:hypothetical protein
LIATPPNQEKTKEFGAYYTPLEVARFLVHWAVRSQSDVVLDPSHGGGVFLQAACNRTSMLGGDPARTVFGIELDPLAHAATRQALAALKLPAGNLVRADFFEAIGEWAGKVDALVGNPPFIRYQQFSGPVRKRAAALMEHAGVRVSELASSWAPFVVCGASALREGGRLAMVVPMEMCHAAYARPVLAFLSRSFRTVQLLSFSERLFPHLSQETLLLLADGKGNHQAQFRWRHLSDQAVLAKLGDRPSIRGSRRLDTEAIAAGRQRLIEQFMPAKARGLYAELRNHEFVRPLGAMTDVGIGYVTGANDFFHLSEAKAGQWEIPGCYLQRAVCRGRAFTGLRFTGEDWEAAHGRGDAAYLLKLSGRENLPDGVRRYLRHGEASEINQAYKCRVRQPWYHVPHVHRADGFLTYMSGISPRLVVNEAGAVAPNTLHVVRMLPLFEISAGSLTCAWQSSLTELSAEIEGHALGGGMLKLEPTEAGRVLVAIPAAEHGNGQCQVLDVLARHSACDAVRATVDKLLLRGRLGLTEKDCRCLREAVEVLRSRRLGRSG